MPFFASSVLAAIPFAFVVNIAGTKSDTTVLIAAENLKVRQYTTTRRQRSFGVHLTPGALPTPTALSEERAAVEWLASELAKPTDVPKLRS